MDLNDFCARNAVALTPHDTNANAATALYVGGAGTVILRALGSSADATFLAVPAGTTLHVRTAYVRATGTTATGIIALS